MIRLDPQRIGGFCLVLQFIWCAQCTPAANMPLTLQSPSQSFGCPDCSIWLLWLPAVAEGSLGGTATLDIQRSSNPQPGRDPRTQFEPQST